MNIAILTNFSEFNPGYSLTGIVVDQAEMLAKYGHKVYVFVNENFNEKYNDDIGLSQIIKKYPDKIELVPKIVFLHLVDYQTKNNISEEHITGARKQAQFLEGFLIANRITTVFTHDFIFTGWNLPYALALMDTQKRFRGSNIKWLHWVHSIPSGNKDWWYLNEYPGHNYIVFPTRSEVNREAESFQARQSQVLLIPHIKDIRNWYDFSEETKDIIDMYPGLMQHEIVQVYPCSSDRLHAKQLHLLIQLFGFMKKAKSKVFLLAVNQWATGRQRKEDISKYIQLAEHCNLEYGKDFSFTSEIELIGEKPYEIGVSKRILRELQLLQSLFIFPTVEESFGLVGPEAAYSGALVVANKSLPLLAEVLGLHTPQYNFGSFLENVDAIKDDNYLQAVAYSILGRISTSDSVKTKMFCRTRYNMDNIYYKYYLPYILH